MAKEKTKVKDIKVFGNGQLIKTFQIDFENPKSIANAYLGLVQMKSLVETTIWGEDDIRESIEELIVSNPELFRLAKGSVSVVSGRKVIKKIDLGNTKKSLSSALISMREADAVRTIGESSFAEVYEAIVDVINDMPEMLRVTY